ncbi:phosphate signaling complex protein PhoU [Thiomicrorhabdus sp.]|uniref:phosphate signaling complex protein PhoU n=1 Tax=Thiomicrorhabdus sp. TaxID=2039724 RepID=UPI002AA6D845|nr:phosphate signaling complex protein PhoU [Thiomicrorhabdus sp.]
MERELFKSHISGQYNQNLEELFNHILSMGGLVEAQIKSTVEAVKCEDKSLAKEIKQVDKIVNKEELEIDRLCARVLARQQPTASDLRLVVSSIRIAVDLERIGDEAVNASKLATKMSKVKEVPCEVLPGYGALMEMVSIDLDVLKKTLNAFAQLDISQLGDVFDDDNRISEIKKKALIEINEALNNNTEDLAEYIMQMFFSIRACERISAHIVNIAESIIYLVKGKDVRHMNSEKLDSFLSTLSKE